jgi:hypothetical protein
MSPAGDILFKSAVYSLDRQSYAPSEDSALKTLFLKRPYGAAHRLMDSAGGGLNQGNRMKERQPYDF